MNPSQPGPHPFTPFPCPNPSKTARLIDEAAKACKLLHFVEPEFGFVGRIESPRPTKQRFPLFYRTSLLSINSAGSSALARDKGYSFGLLMEAKLPIPKTRTFFSPDFEEFARLRGTAAALRFAKEIGYPVFVKPNEGTRAFNANRADNDDELCWALERSFATKAGRVTIVQEFIPGTETRFLTLDGKVKIAYKKRPFILQANHTHTIRQVLAEAQKELFQRRGKTFKMEDPRIHESLRRRGLDLDDVLQQDIPLCDGLSLELGNGVEIIQDLPQEHHDIACKALEALGLRFGSVDAIVRDNGQLVIIEVNSAPGVTGLAALGHRDKAVQLYIDIMQAHFSN